jgi:hypothetical protein
MEWQVLAERPGYLGKHRAEKYAEWDHMYGKSNWHLIWKWGKRYIEYIVACQVYEKSYLAFLAGHKDILEELVNVASDVYDDSPTNVNSGCDYRKQETDRTHIQDIAIRRVVKQLGLTFKGHELIQIRDVRGTHRLSMILSPGRVPFHKPDLIVQPWLEGWWEPGSVECFYQSNRYLECRE